MQESNIPKKIWTFWYQGLSDAPFLVKKCIASWADKNPGWEVIVLDRHNLKQYMPADFPYDVLVNKLPIVKFSNAVRLQLMTTYGGVWVDATILCVNPLDSWIHESNTSGFFMFSITGQERIIATWFLACQPNNYLVTQLKNKYIDFFTNHSFDVDSWYKKIIVKILSFFFNRNEETTRYWLSPWVTDWLHIYPYYIFHYLFKRLVVEDEKCHAIWQQMPKINAAEPHKYSSKLANPLTDKIKQDIDQKLTPLYKLTWKFSEKECEPSSVLYYLLK